MGKCVSKKNTPTDTSLSISGGQSLEPIILQQADTNNDGNVTKNEIISRLDLRIVEKKVEEHTRRELKNLLEFKYDTITSIIDMNKDVQKLMTFMNDMKQEQNSSDEKSTINIDETCLIDKTYPIIEDCVKQCMLDYDHGSNRWLLLPKWLEEYIIQNSVRSCVLVLQKVLCDNELLVGLKSINIIDTDTDPAQDSDSDSDQLP